MLTKSELVWLIRPLKGVIVYACRINDTACPHCGAVWAIVLTPVSYAASNVLHYRGTCTCGHPLKGLDDLGHVASLFRLIKPASSGEGPEDV